MRNVTYWNVAPRYSCGSPAQVDEAIAKSVGEDERRFYHRTLEGIYGEDKQAFAKEIGLDRIVWEQREVRGCFEVLDYLTGRLYAVLPYVTAYGRRIQRGDPVRLQDYRAVVVERIEALVPRVARGLQTNDVIVTREGERIPARRILG